MRGESKRRKRKIDKDIAKKMRKKKKENIAAEKNTHTREE